MKKLCLAAMVATVLVGCNAGDEVVEHGGIDINNLSQTQKQDYAELTADALAVIAQAADNCSNGMAVGETKQCDLSASNTTTNIIVAKGQIDVEQQENQTVIVHTTKAMEFTSPNAVTNGEVISLNFSENLDKDYNMTLKTLPGGNNVTFKGMLINTADSDAKYWSTESTTGLALKYDANIKLPSLISGNAVITGKDNQTFNWSADSNGDITAQ
ncbi:MULTISPECIES: hypothetical protein [unclassified Photobacterium]|uniref:hypothetical protein n=1 Tax=unclassified Photobacterium TaxID=2628852 RepID=UPI000D17A172|nr:MULTISPECIES: hypothetical protein [unclassified Photobacterium]PSV35364.1 hypothetical protein C9J44_12880 [Photobacterium sp. GB-27]PSV36305.1 hypothetical protein C9J38_13870 [Photobacterium sp. GB-210]PSV42115.1 hypothetical protein C9J46_14980 [Photobacterium sp. GB-36]PSV50775.1 hypothetical protein C9J45_18290 [Photobacterium sp. GB-1]PSV54471.1 hypothetical protein C9J43_17295 [Photobacterium sp. GB-3]